MSLKIIKTPFWFYRVWCLWEDFINLWTELDWLFLPPSLISVLNYLTPGSLYQASMKSVADFLAFSKKHRSSTSSLLVESLFYSSILKTQSFILFFSSCPFPLFVSALPPRSYFFLSPFFLSRSSVSCLKSEGWVG